jgi:hypothetical protein
MTKNKRNIVVLSTMYYPDMGAPSACIDKYVQALKNECNFYIITKTYKTEIAKDGRYNIRYISNSIHSTILKCNHNIEKSRFIWVNKFILFLINIYKLTITQFCYPTANSWEIREYYNELKLLSKEIHIDTIVTVSNTFLCQFAGLKYKKEHGDVKWISFIFDPFSEFYIYYRYKPFKNWWKQKNVRKEELLYQSADFVLFIKEMYNFATSKFSLDLNKMYCIDFTLDDIRKGQQPRSIKPESFVKLLYAGALYKEIRNPEFMLSVLSQIRNIKLDLFGEKGECEDIIQRYLSDNIVRNGFVNKIRYDEMICNEYDILVNIGNISKLQSPSKMLELLSAGRPIVNFYFVKDRQYDMIQRYPLGINIGVHEDGAVEKVSDFCQKMKGRFLPFEDVLRLYPENSLDQQVRLFECLLNH